MRHRSPEQTGNKTELTRDGEMRSLVARASGGDATAFGRIYQEYAPLVYGICLRFAGHDVGWAEQLTQDAFIRVWETLHQFRGSGPFGAWVRRVATTQTLNALRARRRHLEREQSFEELPEIFGRTPLPLSGTGTDLESAVAALPLGARSIFLLHDVHGYTDKEIATMTATAPGTVRSQLHRARKLLRQALDL